MYILFVSWRYYKVLDNCKRNLDVKTSRESKEDIRKKKINKYVKEETSYNK